MLWTPSSALGPFLYLRVTQTLFNTSTSFQSSQAQTYFSHLMLNAELCAEQGLQPPSASHLSGSVLEMGPAVMCENSLLCVCLFVSLFYLAAVVTDWLPFFFLGWIFSIPLWLGDKNQTKMPKWITQKAHQISWIVLKKQTNKKKTAYQ